jgi:hypothetical protein
MSMVSSVVVDGGKDVDTRNHNILILYECHFVVVALLHVGGEFKTLIVKLTTDVREC